MGLSTAWTLGWNLTLVPTASAHPSLKRSSSNACLPLLPGLNCPGVLLPQEHRRRTFKFRGEIQHRDRGGCRRECVMNDPIVKSSRTRFSLVLFGAALAAASVVGQQSKPTTPSGTGTHASNRIACSPQRSCSSARRSWKPQNPSFRTSAKTTPSRRSKKRNKSTRSTRKPCSKPRP